MRFGIASRCIGELDGQGIRGFDHCQRCLGLTAFAAKPLSTVEQPELEWHVEARQAGAVELDTREIMHRFVTLVDQSAKLIEPNVTSIALLKRAAHAIATGRDAKNQGLKAWLVVVVEGAIDENVEGTTIQE